MGFVTDTIQALLPARRSHVEGPLPLTAEKVLDWWAGPPSQAGVRVNANTALQLATVWSCVDLVSRDVARTPLTLYSRNGDARSEAQSENLYHLLHDAPNPLMSSFTFKQTLQAHRMLRGNAFANVERDEDGNVIALWPLLPDRIMDMKFAADGRMLYLYQLPTGEARMLTQDEVLHLRGMSPDGINGYSIIKLHRDTIGIGIAQRDYGARFIANNANPSGVLQKREGKLSDEAAARLAKDWAEAHQGLHNAHRVAVLEDGVEFKAMSVNPEEAQYLESMKYSRTEIGTGIFHVPPHKYGEMEHATFSNIEEQDLAYQGDTLDAEFALWEQEVNRTLLTPKQRATLHFEYNRNALVRSTQEKRFNAYGKAITDGWMTRNEVRQRENLNPLPLLDEPLQPLNMVTAGTEPEPQAALAEPNP